MNELEKLQGEVLAHVRLNPGELASRARLCRLVEFGREYPEERAMTDEERRKANGQRARGGLVSRWVEVGVLSLFLAAGTVGVGQSLTNAWWDGWTLRLQYTDAGALVGLGVGFFYNDMYDSTWTFPDDSGDYSVPASGWETMVDLEWVPVDLSVSPPSDGVYEAQFYEVANSTFGVSGGVAGQIGNFPGPVVPEAPPLAFGLASLLMLFRSSVRGFRGGQLFSCSWLRCLGCAGYSGEWLSRKEVID